MICTTCTYIRKSYALAQLIYDFQSKIILFVYIRFHSNMACRKARLCMKWKIPDLENNRKLQIELLFFLYVHVISIKMHCYCYYSFMYCDCDFLHYYLFHCSFFQSYLASLYFDILLNNTQFIFLNVIRLVLFSSLFIQENWER